MRTFLTLGIVVAALAAVPFFGSAYLTSFLFTVLIAYILGQSWDWVAGEMGYVNLGHFVFYGLGAYVFAIALVAKYPSTVAILIAVLLTVAVAALLAFPLFRLRGDYFAFATLALLPLAELLAYNLSDLTKGGDGIVLPIENVMRQTYMIALAICVVTFIVTIRINGVRFGYALKSIRNDEDVAEVLGVRIAPVKTAVLALSAAFAAMAGATQAWQMSYIDPATVFGLNVALIPVAMVLFGGSGLRWGPLVGVVLLACLQQWLLVRMEILHATVYGLIILLIGRFMPGGLLRAAWVRNSRWLAPLSREHHSFIVQAPVAVAAVRAEGSWPRLPLPAIKPRPGTPLLQCRGVRMVFGGNVAVDDVTLDINEGEIVGLIGPNGSGKTTLFNCISRVYTPTAGELSFGGQALASMRRDQIAKLGVGRTHQIPRPFGDLTVQENIAIPLMFHDHSLSPAQAFEQSRAFMAFADLERRSGDRADSLSLQEKKALEFARALACKPRLLLVDEVASGLTPAEVRRFVEQIRHVRDEYGITVIWVEHIFSALAQVVDRVVALEQGAVIANGSLDDVVKNERVLQGYLGSAAEEAA
ncbi:branched-chain amino acid ABC transporter ATP-binding protein/permease [Lacisediminimonas profundi]|uniref:branched-chain amino acid ABC transporter ATP-binding protein/permease n=1 Tax=Lacisediminimonas profundi TaxID=2603856 RepID=UPI00124B5812|nr:branched-chain amino acid ABC transporter ATP-binding protein/permease [Lacisediminimonas profundi]